jgi:hypothetical protein
MAVAGLLLLAASALFGRPGPRCLVESDGACIDGRLTGRASGYVSSIDSETPGVPLFYVEFEAAGARVQAKVANWPAAPGGPANGPRVGSTVNVAYDPAAPAEHATDADALAALPGLPPEPAGGAAVAARWAGLVLWVGAAVLAVRGRRRTGATAPGDAA